MIMSTGTLCFYLHNMCEKTTKKVQQYNVGEHVYWSGLTFSGFENNLFYSRIKIKVDVVLWHQRFVINDFPWKITWKVQ